MIDPDVRNAIYQSHLAGVPLQEISRQFQVSRNTVRAIIGQQGPARPDGAEEQYLMLTPSCSPGFTGNAAAGLTGCTRGWWRRKRSP